MENFDTIFEAVFKKYNAKDYFMTKQTVRNKLLYAKQNNITVKYSEVKKYLLNEKAKCYKMIIERIQEKKEGKHFPKSEKFTWAIFNKLTI